MVRKVLTAYLKDLEPRFKLPCMISSHVMICQVTVPPLAQRHESTIPEKMQFAIEVYDVEERVSLSYAFDTIRAIRIASSCSTEIAGFAKADGTFSKSVDAGLGGPWGHYSQELTEDSVEFVRKHIEWLANYSSPETYNRFANALRIYHGALVTPNADFALLGFVGAIESLFSIAAQELSFRLSLLLAKFLGDDSKDQRQYFNQTHGLYKVRSKIAHGDKIVSDEEQAAIQIVDYWTPLAEELARLSIRRIVEYRLADIFNSPQKHKRLLTEILFEGNLGSTMKLLQDNGSNIDKDEDANREQL